MSSWPRSPRLLVCLETLDEACGQRRDVLAPETGQPRGVRTRDFGVERPRLRARPHIVDHQNVAGCRPPGVIAHLQGLVIGLALREREVAPVSAGAAAGSDGAAVFA